MFTSLRLNLTGKFLILSLSVYIILSVISAYFFHNGLTQSLDQQLQEIYAVVFPSIEVNDDDSISLRDPPKQLRVSRNVLVSPTVSLFDDEKHLIMQHGPKGSETLLKSGTEAVFGPVRLRTLANPIYSEGMKGETVGYVQIQLNTS